MAIAIILLPLLGALIVGLTTRVISNKSAQLITSSFLVVSAIISWITFFDLTTGGKPYVIEAFRWIDSGSFKANWAVKIDVLTAVMLILITTVSAVVHIYSIGYMSHDPHLPRFMAYLSLFTFFMLMMVTSDNFIQLFLGWEGVGLCSYLLIGFWFKKDSANKASMKAFIVNRVGDFGFALGIFAIYLVFDSVEFASVFEQVSSKADEKINFLGGQFHTITTICFLLFIGAMGKSAQLGLHTWLPDAMEGPTPVSALIHAATMVTAGVFLVARCSPLFEMAPLALDFITIVGGLTAIFAATIAITQNDIKKVIAYSTCSQLGYMFFACGVSAYSAGVFHLLTHGFFKALLFLGAGSVIHAMSNEQDMRKMGGIWKKIPYSYAMMWIGSLALVGIFPFAGFFSKDMVLEAAYAKGGVGSIAFWLGISAAFLTAFYSWRLIIMTFHGKCRASQEVQDKIHESPKIMMLPLYVLCIGAIFSGGIGYYIYGIVDSDVAKFWNGSITILDKNNILEEAHHVALWVKLLPLVVGVLGIFLAYVFYMFKPEIPSKIANKLSYIYRFLLNKWFIDELYEKLFVAPTKKLGSILWKIGDIKIIDRFGPDGVAFSSNKFSHIIAKVQSGYLYNYALVMLAGMVLLISFFLFNFMVN